jgi:hypothetical protein
MTKSYARTLFEASRPQRPQPSSRAHCLHSLDVPTVTGRRFDDSLNRRIGRDTINHVSLTKGD